VITHIHHPTMPRLSLLALLICTTYSATATGGNYLATINAEANKFSTAAVSPQRSGKTRTNGSRTPVTAKNRPIASKNIASQLAFDRYLARHLRASYHYYQQLKKPDRQRVFNTAVASRSIPSVRRRIIDLYLASAR